MPLVTTTNPQAMHGERRSHKRLYFVKIIDLRRRRRDRVCVTPKYICQAGPIVPPCARSICDIVTPLVTISHGKAVQTRQTGVQALRLWGYGTRMVQKDPTSYFGNFREFLGRSKCALHLQNSIKAQRGKCVENKGTAV